jgi:hypothetical protein
MLTDQSIDHCISVGHDKQGMTKCQDCPDAIRTACHGCLSGSVEALRKWHNGVNQAVQAHYSSDQLQQEFAAVQDQQS